MNEPAFPTKLIKSHYVVPDYSEGMTLQDYFSAKAMEALLLHAKGETDATKIAKQSYLMAKAMLIERSKQ